jgi:predicted RNA binding protein YcfA (HicA-like mRNA interferase family)/predicted RNase H-like HicB family nuclease
MKVGEVVRILHDAGWVLVRVRGDHRQFKHPDRQGLVTVPGKLSDDVRPGTLNSILKQAGLKPLRVVMRYAIVVEKAESNYSAYVPDLPGCVATGVTLEEVETQMREAIEFHLEGMREEGLPIPEPSSVVEYLDVSN